jgi:drug/metabolite transporter superfamily protein YnfA
MRIFDRVMRVVSTLIGVLMAAMGGVWILQGFKIAFLNSFMAGDLHWALYGAILAAVGVCQIIWSTRRHR